MSWFKKPVNIGITIGAAILAVVAIGLIVWGVTHHSEGEMLRVCWVNGEARYTDDTEGSSGSCDRPEELVWPEKQIPIAVAATTPDGQALGPDTDEGRAVEQAVTDFNQQVGFRLFRVERELGSASAIVRLGGAFQSGGESPPPGHVTHRRVATGLRGHVFVRSDVAADSRLLHVVLLHELGHLVGLEHDDFTLSIMYPLAREEWESGEMSTAHVTDRDKANLRHRYHDR